MASYDLSGFVAGALGFNLELKALQHPMSFVFEIWQFFQTKFEKLRRKKKSEKRLCASGVAHVAVLTSYYVLWD